MTSSPHFTNICTLPLQSDLFCQSLHPTRPLLAVGLASGHVHTFRLPSTEQEQADVETASDPPSTLFSLVNVHTNGSSNGNGNGDHATASILSTRRRSSTASENGLGSIETLWRTRRHKGSCRTIAYSNDGKYCYSAGTDGLVKVFESESGKVVAKIAVPVPVPAAGSATKSKAANDEIDAPTTIYELTPMHLVVTTDSGAVYVYDITPGTHRKSDGNELRKDQARKPSKRQRIQEESKPESEDVDFSIAARPSRIEHPHRDEHVNALVPLPPSESSTSGFPKQFVSVGGSTLAVTDVHRKKGCVVATSEDQEAELMSCLVVSGLKKGGTSVGEKVLVGQSDGVLSLWERGVWGDLDERIVVDKAGASIDALCEIPREFLPRTGGGKLKMNEKIIACGLDDGRIRFVRIGRNGVIFEWDLKHDDIDGVVSLIFDTKGNRLVSGGGQTVKIWTRAQIAEGAQQGSSLQQQNGNVHSAKNGEDDNKDEEWESAEDDESDNSEGEEEIIQYGDTDSDEDDDEEQEEDDSDEDANRGKRKKRKRNKGKADASGRALNLSGVF